MMYGNLNTTLVGDPRGEFRHMVGSGGANDIASCARRTIIIMRHEARKLKQAISFITSPGYITGGDSRLKAGLGGGPSRVITDKAIFGFHPETKQMMLISIHPGNTLEDVLGTMGFHSNCPAACAVHRASCLRTTAPDPRGDRPKTHVYGMNVSFTDRLFQTPRIEVGCHTLLRVNVFYAEPVLWVVRAMQSPKETHNPTSISMSVSSAVRASETALRKRLSISMTMSTKPCWLHKAPVERSHPDLWLRLYR